MKEDANSGKLIRGQWPCSKSERDVTKKGKGVNAPEIDELFGFLGGCEVVDVYQHWIGRDDLSRVLMRRARLKQVFWF
jgi:hypothetical protein